MAFIGTPLDTRNTFQSLQGKRFNGDGSTTAFTLDVAPSSTLDIEVFVGNVRQDPNSAYTLSGTTLSFTGAPPSGTNNIYVVHQAKSVGTIDVPTGGVAAGSLATSVLTGQTDIGGAIADADLFLIDDGAGGTLRKTAASRIKTYAGFSVSDITGATELAATPADTDELIISDAGTLKRIDYSYLKSANSPFFLAERTSSEQQISDNTTTKIQFNTETLDSGTVYDPSTNYRFTPGVAGKYFVFSGAGLSGDANNQFLDGSLYMYKNGSEEVQAHANMAENYPRTLTLTISHIFDLDDNDYIEMYAYVNRQTSGNARVRASNDTYFGAFKLT